MKSIREAFSLRDINLMARSKDIDPNNNTILNYR